MTVHHFTGPKGWPAITADPQRRSWVESGKGGRWTCTCGKATATRDAGDLHAFAKEHAHAQLEPDDDAADAVAQHADEMA